MRCRWLQFWAWVLAGVIGGVLPGLAAQAPPTEEPGLAHVTVTVHSTAPGKAPVLTADDVRVYEHSRSRPVKSWVAAEPETGPLDLTVLLDDSVLPGVSLQFRDLADFFSTLPAGTRVRIAYAQFGGNQIVQDFTTHYASAAKALRLPVGATMAGGSIYDSVSDLVKKWPPDGHRRALLLIGDGIDITQGLADTEPPLNMELQHAVKEAQKAGVSTYTIFARGAHSLEGSLFLLNNGQSCLLNLSAATGGQSFFQGTRTPLDFAPYLRQFAADLHHQYVLTFLASPASQPGYRRIKVTTEVPGVRLSAPTSIFVAKTS